MQTWHLDQLKTATSLPGKEGVCLWLPSELVSLHEVQKPIAPKRKWPALLPWLIEDLLLDTPEQMHFVVLEERPETLLVLVTANKALVQAVEQAEKTGIKVSTLQPDYLALPWRPGSISIAWRLAESGRLLLVRDGLLTGYAVSEQMAEVLLEPALSNSSNQVNALMPEEALPAFLGRYSVSCGSAPDWHADPVDKLNLLQGKHARAPEADKSNRWPLVAAGLFVFAVVLAYTWLRLDIAARQSEVAALEEYRAQQFARAFPGIRLSDGDVQASLESVQADRFLQREKLQEPVAGLLLALDPVISGCANTCQLNSLTADAETATLDFAGDISVGLLRNLPSWSATASEGEDGITRITLRGGAR